MGKYCCEAPKEATTLVLEYAFSLAGASERKCIAAFGANNALVTCDYIFNLTRNAFSIPRHMKTSNDMSINYFSVGV